MQRNKNKLFGLYKTFSNNKDAKGIGLFITKNQVEAMGGKIEIESELNIGTTVRIFFKN
jgi:signal transduction histidine kinase